jgi:putative FmdB family regulatory protein
VPLYDYTCGDCGHQAEFLEAPDYPRRDCPKCGHAMRRRVPTSNFALKGKGWAKDGYSKKD